MNYDRLTAQYRQRQLERMSRALSRLSSEPATGRTVPDADDLIIGEGRRLDVAVAFLDISGFSMWPSETAVEQARNLRVLNIFFTEMVRIAEDYGGTVEKNTGDGLMVYFEDGGYESDDSGCKRALGSALTMMDTGTAIVDPLLASASLGPVPFRIAIDHGPVTITKLGAPRRFTAAVAVGTAANLASKMLGFAQAHEIVIGDSVRRRLPELWQAQWTEALDVPTGWVYRQSGLRYPFYKYTGRWRHPLA